MQLRHYACFEARLWLAPQHEEIVGGPTIMAGEPLPLLPHEERLPPRTDLWVAASFFVLSAAILVLSWRMPTYADQGGEIYTAPGLVPSFYGVVIGVLSLWLAMRALRGGALAPASAHQERPDSGNSNARFALAAG